MLNSNKQDKKAKQGAMEELLKNWKETISYQRCDNLKKSWINWKRRSLKKEKSIASLNDEVDELNFWLQDCEPRSQMPAGYFCCV